MHAAYIFTDFPLYTKNEGTKYLKCTSFIIIHDKYGPIIFDSGSPYDSNTLIEFLKTHLNLNPLDIQWLFISHIHPDHVGANRFFKNAKIILSKQEYEFTKKIADIVFKEGNLLKFLHANCPGYVSTFGEFEANNMRRYIKENWSEEKLGITSNTNYIEDNPIIPDFIKIIPTFGHTFYHYSFLMNTPELNILFTGDALSMRMVLRESREDRFLEPHMDFNIYFNSLDDKISHFNGLIIPGHDRPFFSNNFKSIRKQIFKIKDILLFAEY